jgi:hypothetical protein
MEYKQFPNIGYYQHKFNNSDLAFLKEEINSIKKDFDSGNPFNRNLAGNMEREYFLDNSIKKLNNLLAPLVTDYHNQSDVLNNFNIMSKTLPVYLDTAWVNFQGKYEFNPCHNHEGVLSFVLWMDIPYDLKEEMEHGLGKKSGSNVPGFFEFQYVCTLGHVVSLPIPISKDMENTILLFPSKMIHCVYPFSVSNGYRTSVSGNFKLLVDGTEQ